MPAKPLTETQKQDADRLKVLFKHWQAVRASEGLPSSQEWCSEKLQFGQSAITQYINGKIPLNPTAASNFAKLIGCKVAEFSCDIAAEIESISLGNNGQTESSTVIELGNFRGKSKPDEFVIPEFNTGGSMGVGLILRDQPGVIRGWSVNQEWVSKNVKSHTSAENLCIVTGFGDSMKGMFNPGDPLLVDRGVTSVDYDAVYFFRVDGEGYIKRLQRIPGEGIRAISSNKEYESWTIKQGMDFEVFGRVLKAWQGEKF